MKVELDSPAPIRPGEEFPSEKLVAYLQQQLPDLRGEATIEQFPHGHSNLTYLIRFGSAEYVLRRPPFGNQVQTAHDMSREYKVLAKLSAVYAPAPRPYLYCDDESILGAPFYLMERRRGVILRKTLPPGLARDPASMRQLSVALVNNLVRLHAIDYQSAGLAELGKPAGYVSRQVRGWIERYAKAQTGPSATIERLTQWLAANTPPESGAVVIHNDYKFDNLLLHPENPTRIVAVLDWEMATLGDPLMDLGTTLGYWIEETDPESLRLAAMGPTTLPGTLSRREVVDRYAEYSGREVADSLFYYCFGLFKIAVIVQQMYARYVRGHTRDPRFAKLNGVVTVLAEQADRTLNAGAL